jgi:hypothetical protein
LHGLKELLSKWQKKENLTFDESSFLLGIGQTCNGIILLVLFVATLIAISFYNFILTILIIILYFVSRQFIPVNHLENAKIAMSNAERNMKYLISKNKFNHSDIEKYANLQAKLEDYIIDELDKKTNKNKEND